MNKKKQILLDLKKYVEEGKNIRYRYYEDGCYCAVGYILHKVDVPDDVLWECSTQRIKNIPYQEVFSKIEDTGFTYDELDDLQWMNDTGNEELLNTINGMLELEEYEDEGNI